MVTRDTHTIRRDRVWAIIGAISGVIAVAVAIFLFVLERRERAYQQRSVLEVLADSPTIVQIPRDISVGPKLAIFYDGQPVAKYVVLRARMRNAGAQPVIPSDVVVPITLHFHGHQKLTHVAITNEQPHGLGAGASLSSDHVELKSILLNPGDYYSLEIGAIAQPGSDPKVSSVTGRVKGVTEIQLRRENIPDDNLSSVLEQLRQVRVVTSVVMALTFAALAVSLFEWWLLRRKKST